MDRYNYKTDNLSGLDMHWYAVDQDGFIAEFWTCGNLPIPGLISHNDLRRIEYYADILFNQEDLTKKPCGSRTKLDFYGYDENRDGTTWQCPYAQVERPEHPMKIDELPEEIRQSITIHLPISFTSKENIPLSAIPDPIDVGNPFIETGETPEEKRREAEEGTRLWKELQNRFDLGFEKRSEVYIFVRNEFDTKDFRALFCPECYEKHGLIYPWKCIEVPEKRMVLKGSTYVETVGDYVFRCKYCDVDYHKPIAWQFSDDSTLTEHPNGTCDVETIDRIPDVKIEQIRWTARLFRLGRKAVLYGILFLFFLWIIGLFHPFVFYYLIFQPSRVYVDAEHLAYYKALDEGNAERNPDDPYERIIQGTWKLESPYSRPFDKYWFGWKKTRLHLYPDGRFELVSPIRHLDYLWEDEENTENRAGTWKPLYSLHYGYSICFDDDKEANSNLRYMMLWDTKATNPMKRYKLCQTLDFSTDLMGTVWIKVSDHAGESK